MGLLDQKKEMDNKLKFFWNEDGDKKLIAWIDEYDGSLVVIQKQMNSIEICKAVCKWYLSICDEL